MRGTKTCLNEVAEQHQDAFKQWLDSNVPAEAEKQAESDRNKARKMYRYYYRDYLRPTHLPKNSRHQHISYWG